MPSPHGQQESQASADRITPQLGLLTPEPRLAAFLENAATLLTFRDTQSFKDKQGLCTEAPWPDIFFSSNLPWRGIVQSGLLHLLVVGLLLNFPHLQTKPSVQPRRSFFDHTQLTYYKTADYLPPL